MTEHAAASVPDTMPVLERTRATAVLAEDINREHRLAHESAGDALGHAIRCGELLRAKKAELAHGEFIPWVEAHCEFSRQSAQAYMRVAGQKASALAFSSLRQALGWDRLKLEKKALRAAELNAQALEILSNPPELAHVIADVVVIDPPWPYGTEYSPDWRGACPYPEMSLEAIQADVAERLHLAQSCVLWLWTTHQFMRHAFPLLDAWGFAEKAILTWVKDRMGLGCWLRSQSEFCILAVRGSPTVTLTNQTTVLHGPMREHSRKPDEFYALVEALCPGVKVDFYSREPREGWFQFGNDTAKFS